MGIMEFPKKIVEEKFDSEDLVEILGVVCILASVLIPVIVLIVLWIKKDFFTAFRWTFLCFSGLAILYKIFFAISWDEYAMLFVWILVLGGLNVAGFLFGNWGCLIAGIVGLSIFGYLMFDNFI